MHISFTFTQFSRKPFLQVIYCFGKVDILQNPPKRGIVMLWKDLLIQMNQIRFKGIVSQFLFFWIFGYYIGVWYSLVWLEGSSINIQLTVLEQKFWDWEDTLPMLGKFPNNPILVFRILPWVVVYLYSDMAREIWAGIFSKLRGAWNNGESRFNRHIADPEKENIGKPVLTDRIQIGRRRKPQLRSLLALLKSSLQAPR